MRSGDDANVDDSGEFDRPFGSRPGGLRDPRLSDPHRHACARAGPRFRCARAPARGAAAVDRSDPPGVRAGREPGSATGPARHPAARIQLRARRVGELYAAGLCAAGLRAAQPDRGRIAATPFAATPPVAPDAANCRAPPGAANAHPTADAAARGSLSCPRDPLPTRPRTGDRRRPGGGADANVLKVLATIDTSPKIGFFGDNSARPGTPVTLFWPGTMSVEQMHFFLRDFYARPLEVKSEVYFYGDQEASVRFDGIPDPERLREPARGAVAARYEVRSAQANLKELVA